MTKTVLLASVAAFALAAGGASAAKVNHPGVATPKGHFAHFTVFKTPKGSGTLYDQNNDANGVGIVSDNFDSGSFDSYDNQGADDFTVPAGHKWIVKEVDVSGVYFNGYGPADGVNVYFYKTKHGLPGQEARSVIGASYTDDGFGNFSISLGKGAKLKAGSYFVSVQADMNFIAGNGEWGWETRNTQSGNPAAFRSSGGFGCTNWGVMTSCIGSYGEGPDYMFTLKGKDKS